jgi:hypothetical protein
MKELIKIQTELKAPKNQYNSFGKYKYRSVEDILEAVKPLLAKYECILTIYDQVREVNGITFVEATASIQKDSEVRLVTAQAGIDINRKGMDIAQSFGSSSSYARKYALNGLFLIDDTKDPDSTNDHSTKSNTINSKENSKVWLDKDDQLDAAINYLKSGGKIEAIESKYILSKEIKEVLTNVINQL